MGDQWRFLRGAGMGGGFTGTWVESGDVDAVVALLGADPASRRDCDLATAMGHYRPMAFTECVWIGPHADGWTHVLTVSGPPPVLAGVIGAGLRFLQVRTFGDYVHDLFCGDGITTAWVIWRWHGEILVEPGSLPEPYLREIDQFSAVPGVAHFRSWITELEGPPRGRLETYLLLAGRMSGRFIDREWLGEKRTLYTIPPPPRTDTGP